MRSALRRNVPADACEWTEWLKKYLSISDPDPFDFLHAFEKWGALAGYEDVCDLDLSALSPEERADLDNLVRGEVELMWRYEPTMLPAYLAFDGPRLNGPGTWLVHFSREYFTSFDRGVTLEGLHLSTHLRHKPTVDCAQNLSPDIGPYEVVWGFALDVEGRQNWSDMARSYGGQVLLFQTDCSVEAYHESDLQWQTIFPLCTEYNVHSGTYSGGQFWAGYDYEEGDWIDEAFGSPLEWAEAIEASSG
jgi:hypothetical protein